MTLDVSLFSCVFMIVWMLVVNMLLNFLPEVSLGSFVLICVVYYLLDKIFGDDRVFDICCLPVVSFLRCLMFCSISSLFMISPSSLPLLSLIQIVSSITFLSLSSCVY